MSSMRSRTSITVLKPSAIVGQADILQRQCACGQHTGGGECAACREKREGLQRGAVNSAPVNTVPPIVHDVLNTPGQPLDAKTRAFMEPRFGHDFSQIQVHTKASQQIQTKLTVNKPGDEYEQEADRIAEAVMRMPGSNTEKSYRQSAVKKENLQAKERSDNTSEVMPDTQAYIDSMRDKGQPLSQSTRSFFEPRFGYDFSNVRVHTDQQASESARNINALAYTLGYDIVFETGQYAPNSLAGQRLLAHELTHVVQQNLVGAETNVQRAFHLRELLPSTGTVHPPTNPIAADPDTYFYRGSARNTTDRRALIIAGIHGGEESARELGHEVNKQLTAGTAQTDFHAIVIPQVNPHPNPSSDMSRSAGSGSNLVKDLNREFASGYTSPNPYANRITTVVNEFGPERILSIHAISKPSLGGIFLDPIHTGPYPPVKTGSERQKAFTGGDTATQRSNLEAIHLTEEMVNAAGARNTPGDIPRTDFPASQLPSGTAASPYSLIYPLQGTVDKSLGTWASGLGKTIITLEIPGYKAPSGVWRAFLPAVWRFLQIQSTASSPTPSPAITPNASTGQLHRSPRLTPEIRKKVPNTQVQQEPRQITSTDLKSDPDPDLDRFMKHVYDLQVQLWISQKASYVAGVPSADLAPIPASDIIPSVPSISLHRVVADKVRTLLANARQDLSIARTSGETHAQNVTDIRLRSGYRSAEDQKTVWQINYPMYYKRTKADRQKFGDEHGEEAALFLAKHINETVFSPGYSPHQQGKTVDFSYYDRKYIAKRDKSHWTEADSSPESISMWENSWLFDWLQTHAAQYGFIQNPKIHEPWHWEYHPDVVASVVSFFQWLLNLLRDALQSLRHLFFGEDSAQVPVPERKPLSSPTPNKPN